MDPPEPLTPPALEPPNTESATPDPPDPDTPLIDPAPVAEEPLEVPEILLTEDPEALLLEDENVEPDDNVLEPLVDTDEELDEEDEADPLAFTA